LALLKLGRAEPAWPLLKHSPHPEARSRLIQQMAPAGVGVAALADRLLTEKDASIRRALILTLGEFTEEQVPADLRRRLGEKLVGWYRDEPDPGVHAAIDWLLRHDAEGREKRKLRWGRRGELERIDDDLAARSRAAAAARAACLVAGALPLAGPSLARRDEGGGRRWYVNGQGQTLVIVDGREPFLMGSPTDEAGRVAGEAHHRRAAGRRFAIATKPVTVAQFERFLKAHPEVKHISSKQHSPEAECPANAVTWYEAAAYCRWLSEQEGLPGHEMVYPPVKEIVRSAGGEAPLRLPRRYLARTGYRLPTEAEWEYACRAGAATSRSYGSSVELLGRYAWYRDNAQSRTWPVGQKRPNDLGLFDLHGNVWTWCHDGAGLYPAGEGDEPGQRDVIGGLNRVLRGGSFTLNAGNVRSANRGTYGPSYRVNVVGARVARTCD
jgi:formylglycine-generating enzyme required for sulfatase activity